MLAFIMVLGGLRMLEQIKQSVQGNLSHYREASSVYHDLAINVALGLVGVVVYVYFTGWVSWIGAVWAILNLLPVVTWVMQV